MRKIIAIILILMFAMPTAIFAEETESEVQFIKVDEKLNIDYEHNNFCELTKYLEKNVAGFIPELFEIEITNNSWAGHNYYTVLYGAQINGFETTYKVIVFVEDENIEYSVSFNEYDIEALMLLPKDITENTYENEFEEAKKQAAKAVPYYASIVEQTVTKKFDRNLDLEIGVSTVCMDEEGCYFVLGCWYYLTNIKEILA
ncbi:MAG: hypothetical protein HFE62_05630 [Firmicutes bacterium]|nr:hypothetical protein [Bacillota bacterium]